MKWLYQEIIAVIATVTILVGLPVAVFQHGPWVTDGDHRVLHLTGVMRSGAWTTEEVNGLNYWWKSFQPARIIVEQGEELLLRLSSSDGTHSFYIPELNIGPIQVEAGHTVEVALQADLPGEFTYYCITVCGECHYYMRGTVKVGTIVNNVSPLDPLGGLHCSTHDSPGEFTSFIERGKYLYTRSGCVTCHGIDGRGGISNPNYVKGSVPPLQNLADKMKIFWEEDAATVIRLLESNVNFESLADDPPIDNFSRFLAQYKSVYNKIQNGSPKVQKLDPRGPEPPLVMPSWQQEISQRDIRSILAYLISLNPWDGYE